jgi:hypothetical protein
MRLIPYPRFSPEEAAHCSPTRTREGVGREARGGATSPPITPSRLWRVEGGICVAVRGASYRVKRRR